MTPFIKSIPFIYGIATMLICGAPPAYSQSTSTGANDLNVSEDVVILPEFSVQAKDDGSYLSTQTTSGTRIATPITKLPYAMQVIPEDFMQDFQLFELEDLGGFISGLGPADPASGSGGSTLRGFGVPYFRNGFYRTQSPDSNSIARIEVIKGPQSAIYGRTSPGGVINYISKKPQTRFRAGLSGTIGTYDWERVDGYVTGPLVRGKLYYRLDMANYLSNRATDFWFSDTVNISGGLTYKFSQDTSLTLEYEYTLREMNGGQAFPRYLDANGYRQGSVYDLPDRNDAKRLISYLTNGAFYETNRKNNAAYLQFEHRMSSDLSFRVNAGYSQRDFYQNGPTGLGTWDTRDRQWSSSTGGNVNRNMVHRNYDYKEYGVQVDATKIWLTNIKQRTLLTFDYFNQQSDQISYTLSDNSGYTGLNLTNALDKIGYSTPQQLDAWFRPDPFNPDVSGYLQIPKFDGNNNWQKKAYNRAGNQRWYNDTGWYINDTSPSQRARFSGALLNHTMEFFDGRVNLTGSVRNDWVYVKQEQPYYIPVNASDKSGKGAGGTDEFVYSVGCTVNIVQEMVIAYGSYGTSFNPSPQVDKNTGELLGFTTGKGGELGIKGLLLNNRLSYAISGFHIEQDGVVTANPNNPDNDPNIPASVPGAKIRATGLNIDISGSVTAGLSMLGSIGWTDLEIIEHKGDPSLVGTTPTGGYYPPRTIGIGATYRFQSELLKRFRIGVKYQYSASYLRTPKSPDVPNDSDFYVPEQSTAGINIGYNYRLPSKIVVDMSLNILNVFDQERITPASYAPNGREIRFTMRFTY